MRTREPRLRQTDSRRPSRSVVIADLALRGLAGLDVESDCTRGRRSGLPVLGVGRRARRRPPARPPVRKRGRSTDPGASRRGVDLSDLWNAT